MYIFMYMYRFMYYNMYMIYNASNLRANLKEVLDNAQKARVLIVRGTRLYSLEALGDSGLRDGEELIADNDPEPVKKKPAIELAVITTNPISGTQRVKTCKTHGLPAQVNGKCLQKGCKG